MKIFFRLSRCFETEFSFASSIQQPVFSIQRPIASSQLCAPRYRTTHSIAALGCFVAPLLAMTNWGGIGVSGIKGDDYWILAAEYWLLDTADERFSFIRRGAMAPLRR